MRLGRGGWGGGRGAVVLEHYVGLRNACDCVTTASMTLFSMLMLARILGCC